VAQKLYEQDSRNYAIGIYSIIPDKSYKIE